MSEGVAVRMLHSADDLTAAERLLSRVWGGGTGQLDAATMRAFEHTGNYVAGAFTSSGTGELVGCAVGFFGPPAERTLHSHIAGVDPRLAGRGIGTLLKHHQRDWCLALGVTSMTWTYDPAIARNAFFNLAKLGVRVLAYLEDFYGPLDDGLNAGSPSDRLLVRWDLEHPAAASNRTSVRGPRPYALAVGADGDPVPCLVDTQTTALLVQVPPDIERLRRNDAALALRWRTALREVLGARLQNDAWRVTGFLRPENGTPGSYLLERTT